MLVSTGKYSSQFLTVSMQFCQQIFSKLSLYSVMPSFGVATMGAQPIFRGSVPENPDNYFVPLKKAPQIFLKWAPYRLFTYLADSFPADSLKPDMLADEGLYLTKSCQKLVTCNFCFNVSIPLSEARNELGAMNKDQLRQWHMQQAHYCPINQIMNEDVGICGDSKKYEANRLASLLAATIREPSIWGSVNALERCLDLARDGFYYLGPGDKVRCEFCHVEVCEWDAWDTVHVEHMKFNSRCPLHSVGGGCTGNVRIGEEQMTECKIDAIPFAGPERIKKEVLSFPNFKDLTIRRDSFDTSRWPHKRFLAAARMAACGLFFTGQGDLVACYKCGIGLHKWEENDAPEDVHARYSHNCQLDKV